MEYVARAGRTLIAALLSAAALSADAPRAARGEGGLSIPKGPEPPPIELPYFPRRLDAVLFRNWGVVPPDRIARALGAEEAAVRALAGELGLGEPPPVGDEALRRSAITAIRRNWHLLPYPQLLELLGWDEGRLGYTLREDDFLWIKLGSLKPRCEPIRFEEPGEADRARHREIRALVEPTLGVGGLRAFAPRFGFLEELRAAETGSRRLPGGPRPGEADLSTGWTLRLDAGCGEVARLAAGRFRERLREGLGVDLAAGGDGPVVAVALEPERFEKPESHEIEVRADGIAIRARDDEGVLRALDRLLDRLERRGGPYLEPGRVRREPRFEARFLHSYFALYGDALLEPGLDPYPDGYLEKLSRLGVNGVWLPGLLRQLAPAAERLGLAPAGGRTAAEREARLGNLAALVERARRYGIGVYLYLNEPRAMPLDYFKGRPELKGVAEGDAAALCTSVPAVREWLADSVAHLLERVPDLAGLFTITMSENLTSCHSHGRGAGCPRCRERPGAEVVAEVNKLVAEGVRRSGSRARVIAWDWGWPAGWVEPIIAALPEKTAVMSVSEWSLPIRRGGVDTAVGEYSISAVGPGPRARRSWELARARGLRTFAKVQAGNTWELSAVPYIPAVGLPAEHGRRLAGEGIDGVMLGWTLGGYPSPNIEVFLRYAFQESGSEEKKEEEGPPSTASVLAAVAERRFGPRLAGRAAAAWERLSRAFVEYPFHIRLVYTSPVQFGPANLLHPEETGYRATMIGFPYDDLESWRGDYPPETMASQFEAVARGWEEGLRLLAPFEELPEDVRREVIELHRKNYIDERRVAEAALLHFRSVAAQVRFVLACRRHREAAAGNDRAAAPDAIAALDAMACLAREEEDSARRLLVLVRADPRLGFEATNHYYYMPADLLEKILDCRWILDTWIPAARRRLPD